MKLPSLKIGDLNIKYPIILGAMGVGVTRSGLASAVTNAGGLGVISGVNLGFAEPDFLENRLEANLRALKNEIHKAKTLTKDGFIGVNFMVAMNSYADHVKTAVKEGIDFIVSGAGLPTTLPELVKGSKTKIAPIVSSAKACALITKLWDRNYHVVPDAVVLEGIKAGGHLGFKEKELINNSFNLSDTIKAIKEVLKPYEEKYGRKIPLIVAGGIFDGHDIADVLSAGGDGVQMATRFVTTHECDAHIDYKKAYLNAKEEDIDIIVSPVGLPGRAIHNQFIDNINSGNRPRIKKCVNCLQTCNPATTPYCISQALINAVTGDIDNGLIFSGANVFKNNKISGVDDVFHELIDEVNNI